MKNFGIITQCHIHNEMKMLGTQVVGVVRERQFIFLKSIT